MTIYRMNKVMKQKHLNRHLGAGRCTCCWEPGVLGLMLSVFVRGWNVVNVWVPPAVLDGMIPNTFC